LPFLLLLPVINSRTTKSPFVLTLGTGTQPQADLEEMVFNWIQLGGRSVDTALLYTGAQQSIQKALRRLEPHNITRQDIFITSKIPGPLSFNDTMVAVEECQRQLGTSHIDLMLIHWPCATSVPSTNCTTTPSLRKQRLETWAALEALQKRGILSEIGVSNYDQDQVEEILDLGSVPFVNQVEWHLGYHDQRMEEFLRSRQSTLQAYSALGGFAQPAVSLSDPTLVAIAARHNVSTAQVALRWSVQKGVFVLTSTTNTDYMLSDMAIFGFELTAEEMDVLTALTPSNSTSDGRLTT